MIVEDGRVTCVHREVMNYTAIESFCMQRAIENDPRGGRILAGYKKSRHLSQSHRFEINEIIVREIMKKTPCVTDDGVRILVKKILEIFPPHTFSPTPSDSNHTFEKFDCQQPYSKSIEKTSEKSLSVDRGAVNTCTEL